MKKITKKATNAFINDKNFKIDNTKVIVEVREDGYYRKEMTLFNNVIAYKAHPEGRLFISSCGWATPTTRERLNGLLEALELGRVFIKRGIMYYESKSGEVREMGGLYTVAI